MTFERQLFSCFSGFCSLKNFLEPKSFCSYLFARWFPHVTIFFFKKNVCVSLFQAHIFLWVKLLILPIVSCTLDNKNSEKIANKMESPDFLCFWFEIYNNVATDIAVNGESALLWFYVCSLRIFVTYVKTFKIGIRKVYEV